MELNVGLTTQSKRMEMIRRSYLIFMVLFFLGCNHILHAQQVQVGLLDLTIKNNETNFSRIRSCRHLLQAGGISYRESDVLDSVLQYRIVMLAPVVLPGTFTAAEKNQLIQFVENGGVLIASSMRDPALYGLFGVTSFTTHTDLKRMYWHTEDEQDYFDRIDDPMERVISLADSSDTFTTAFNIRSYTPTGDAETLAHYENNLSAVVHHEFGEGNTFLFGLDLRDVVRAFSRADFAATQLRGLKPKEITALWREYKSTH